MGVQLAIGEQATTVYADPRQMRNPQRVAVEAGNALAHRPEQDLSAAAEQEAELRLRRPEGRPGAGGRAPAARSRRARLLPGGAAERTRSTRSRRRCSATRASTTRASPGSSSGSSTYLAGKPGKETVVRDPFGRTIDVVSSTPEQPGRDVFLTIDHTLQAKVESVLRTTVARWHATDGTAIVLDPTTGGDPGDGDRPRLRRQRLRPGAEHPPAQPRRHGHVRARLDLQGRHVRRRADRPASSRRTRGSRCRRRSRSPTGRSTRRSRARPRR